MKNDNDKWLESLRESLDGFEVEPHPGIWDSIAVSYTHLTLPTIRLV